MSKKDKKGEKDKVQKKTKISSKDGKTTSHHIASASTLLADDKIDPTLRSLFAVKQPTVKANQVPQPKVRKTVPESAEDENDAELSEIDEEVEDNSSDAASVNVVEADVANSRDANELGIDIEARNTETAPKRKRKRKAADEELEDAYMSRLVREEEKEAKRLATERAIKRQRLQGQEGALEGEGEDDQMESAGEDVEGESEDENEGAISSPPLVHETEQRNDDELAKANRTVFLGNVSTEAITSKAARKTLINHLGSFFHHVPVPEGSAKHVVESLRFRSTAYASAIPRKAAFAKKELMDATTKSTNAYAVYSSQSLAREAARRLNGTLILGRHLRVDEIAHPAKTDHRRCVFIGNLGFVDDETNIQDANEEDGREKRKRGKEPGDVEEGLWRTFGKCGKVESVRVIRDSKTRVGKGIAYVQFEDENAVEAALLYNEKKFPPMLPRKLRVTRAKAQKRNAKPGSNRPAASKPSMGGYQRKISGEEASRQGRRSKILGKAAAAAAQVQNPRTPRAARPQRPGLSDGIRAPESFIFEGHRATAKHGKSGLKLGGKHGKKKKDRVTKRSQSFKAKKKVQG